MENTHLSDQVVVPDPEHDYHGHPHYGKILLTLLVLLAVSLVVGVLFSPLLAVTLIFGTAVWKTALVMRNFMHLKYEPLLIWVVVGAVLFILFAFFFGVYPDVTAIHREVVPR